MTLYDSQQQDIRPFRLSEEFLEPYKTRKPDFGFNGLGEITYRRTYSRALPNGKKEEWWQTIRRVVEGVYTMQKKWIISNNLGWDNAKAQNSAKEMYERMFSMKFLPAGRGLWAWGSPITEEKGLYMALNSCAMVGTEDIKERLAEPFCFLMDASMLGVGVGFDTKGAGKITIQKPLEEGETYVISDDREGWVISLEKLLNSYFVPNQKEIIFDYSLIRPAGEPIKGFGGIASGHQALEQLHNNIRSVLDKRAGEKITSRDIVDIMNLIGKCVISGNVRRCLRKGTLVHTADGAKPIEEIEVGETLFTSIGTTTVTESVYQGKQQLLRINTDGGFIDCTKEHRIAVLDTPRSYTWKHAKDLLPDDRLVFISPTIEDKKLQIPPFVYEKPLHSTTCADIIVPEVDEEIAWLFGLFYGDGCTYPNFEKDGFNAYISIAFNAKETVAIEKAFRALSRFGVIPTIANKKGENCVTIRVQSKQLAWFFSNYKTARQEMVIPPFIVKGSETIRASYLAGLFDADGSNGRPIQGVVSVYPKFVEQVRSIYTSIGIPVGTRFTRNRPNNWQDIYTITIKGALSRRMFKEKVGIYSCKFVAKNEGKGHDMTYPKLLLENSGKSIPYGKNITITKYDEIFGGDRIFPIKILSIEPAGEDETYDLSVSGEKQEFVLGNGLLVHNTAEMALGEPGDAAFLDLKNYEVNPDRAEYGWASNNSIFTEVGMDYNDIAKRIRNNGEPGILWLENARAYSRMVDKPDYKDKRVIGCNPCGEQSLENQSVCLLVETFPNRNVDLDDYKRTLKFAYLYAKTVTLTKTHWAETNRVMLRNRRIGLSMSGIAQFITDRGIDKLKTWCEEGYKTIRYYDDVYSDWLTIPKSIKVTTLKPSGTTSLLAGATPGIHYPESNFYIRRMRLSKFSDMIEPLQKAGYKIEPAVGQEDSTVVVEFPVSVGKDIRTIKDVSMWEQLSLGAFMQKYWSDNQVSQTVTFNPETEGKDIAHALDMYQYQMKGISFLPTLDEGAYPQMPYEAITEERYNEMVSGLSELDLSTNYEDAVGEKFCNNDVCTI